VCVDVVDVDVKVPPVPEMTNVTVSPAANPVPRSSEKLTLLVLL
jgi:hypothetical protein